VKDLISSRNTRESKKLLRFIQKTIGCDRPSHQCVCGKAMPLDGLRARGDAKARDMSATVRSWGATTFAAYSGYLIFLIGLLTYFGFISKLFSLTGRGRIPFVRDSGQWHGPIHGKNLRTKHPIVVVACRRLYCRAS
jgi:hypothetical protein